MATLRSFCMVLGFLAAYSLSLEGQSQSNISNRILRAERFEDWKAIVKLSHDFQVQDSADLSALTAVLDACQFLACKRDQVSLRGPFVSPPILEFAEAWTDFTTQNPRRARDKFVHLSSIPMHGWIGAYGLLRYAIETGNLQLLDRALAASERFKTKKPIGEEVLHAQIRRAFLTHNYERVSELIASASSEIQLLAQFDYLLWKGDLKSAKDTIDAYVKRYGYDHSIATADTELGNLVLTDQKFEAELVLRLARHPNYWRLHLERISRLKEVTLKSFAHLPLKLAHVRLLRDSMLVSTNDEYARGYLKNLDAVSEIYFDYPQFHVTAAAAYRLVGNFSAAKKRLDIAESQTPLLLATMHERAQLAEAQREMKEAVHWQSQIAMRLPKDPSKKLSLAVVLYASGDYVAARNVIKEIRQLNASYQRSHVDRLDSLIAIELNKQRKI